MNFTIGEGPPGRALTRALEQVRDDVGLHHVVKQTFFLSERVSPSEVEAVVAESYGRATPATGYVFQSPLEDGLISCELWAFTSGAVVDQQDRITTASMPGCRWGFVGGLATTPDDALSDGVRGILTRAQENFLNAGLEFRQVVRTWYYVGRILDPEENEVRYDSFNRARNEFYIGTWPDLCLTPASTGVGMNGRGVAFEGLVISGDPDAVDVSWVDNPLQTKPYMYDNEIESDNRPSFSRGAAVRLADSTLFFVSGTASIRGSDVVYSGDAAAQTRVTIENIAALMTSDNLAAHGGAGGGASLEDLQQIRVYVKHPDDLTPVRDCCRRHLPDIPHVYSAADICRPECLVEIEGVAAFRDDRDGD